MLVRMILALSAILAPALPVAAQDCLKLEFAGREALVRNASTCDMAMAQLPNCTAGGTGDVVLAQIAVEKCEGIFLKRLSAGQRRSYDGKIKSCNAEHKEDKGTLSRAMAATCRADLAQSYAHKYGKP